MGNYFFRAGEIDILDAFHDIYSIYLKVSKLAKIPTIDLIKYCSWKPIPLYLAMSSAVFLYLRRKDPQLHDSYFGICFQQCDFGL